MVPHHNETLVLILISCNVVNHSLGVDDQEAVSVKAADLGQLIKGNGIPCLGFSILILILMVSPVWMAPQCGWPQQDF